MADNVLPFPPGGEPPPPTSEHPEDEHHQDSPEQPPGKPIPTLWVETGPWTEETLPKRPWIAKGYLLRGSVTVVAGAGAAGKSMLCLGYATSLAFGEKWGKFIPLQECRVSLLNAEDDADEQKLRLSAVLRSWGKAPADLAGRVARLGFSRSAHLVNYDPDTGMASPTAAMNELTEHIKAFQPDVVAIDPLVELHNANENDNQALRAVIACFRELARSTNCAILIVHHSRKGSGDAHGDMDMIRGAGAIVGAARVALTCCVMTEKEATDLGIPKTAKGFYFRVDGAKSNYAPLREAEWYERVEHVLDNEETVSCAFPWAPPLRDCTPEDFAALIDCIERAPLPLSPRLSDDPRSFSAACLSIGITAREAQKKALASLFANSGVVQAHFSRPGKAKSDTAIGLRTRNGNPDTVHWED